MISQKTLSIVNFLYNKACGGVKKDLYYKCNM